VYYSTFFFIEVYIPSQGSTRSYMNQGYRYFVSVSMIFLLDLVLIVWQLLFFIILLCHCRYL